MHQKMCNHWEVTVYRNMLYSFSGMSFSMHKIAFIGCTGCFRLHDSVKSLENTPKRSLWFPFPSNNDGLKRYMRRPCDGHRIGLCTSGWILRRQPGLIWRVLPRGNRRTQPLRLKRIPMDAIQKSCKRSERDEIPSKGLHPMCVSIIRCNPWLDLVLSFVYQPYYSLIHWFVPINYHRGYLVPR